jgi:hypothetical protein
MMDMTEMTKMEREYDFRMPLSSEVSFLMILNLMKRKLNFFNTKLI